MAGASQSEPWPDPAVPMETEMLVLRLQLKPAELPTQYLGLGPSILHVKKHPRLTKA